MLALALINSKHSQARTQPQTPKDATIDPKMYEFLKSLQQQQTVPHAQQQQHWLLLIICNIFKRLISFHWEFIIFI